MKTKTSTSIKPVKSSPRAKPSAIEQFFAALASANPNPTTELHYNSTFELLCAVLLSAQATDVSVNKATAVLFKKANTPKAMLDLGQAQLESYISSIGLYRSKAKHLLQTCRLLIDKYEGKIPESREELESLPGVGRKTANVILNVAFDQPTLAVDTHIFRLGNRTGLAPGKTPLEVENAWLKVIPKNYLKNAHHWLILHGRYICTAKVPKCNVCSVRTWCKFDDHQ